MEHQQEVLDYLDKYAHVFNAMVQKVLTHKMSDQPLDVNTMFDPEKFTDLLAGCVKVDTQKLVNSQMALMQKQTELWQQASRAMMGEKVPEVADADPKDRRFAHADWQDNPFFSYLKQAYLLNSSMLQNMIDAMEFNDPKSVEQIKFYTRQYINSVSPSNYLLTNPEVCEEIIKTKGENLMQGMQNFMRDLEASPLEAFKITQTDPNAFKIGENLATTPGKVVFQNDLIQLIHYAPQTDKVYDRPLLIVPPFINKYYILDLDKRKSMVNWLTSQGHAVFLISWVNPDASMADKDFASYMHEGPIAALDVVEKITRKKKINIVGWCVGGTLLATAVAYLRAKGDTRINSMTLLTTLLDFSEPGELGTYINEQMLNSLESNADIKGIFDGRILAMSFSLLRENNLFWSFFINNYLKGKDPAAFDILYWNSDSTNITAACFKEYIHNTYWENRLREPGAVVIDDVPIDLGQIDVPTYFLSTMVDHIVLWKSSYEGTQLVSGPCRFVLAGSGHVAGVINPPEGGKYPHWVNDNLPTQATEWFDSAQKVEGSWWPDWHNWLSEKSNKMVPAYTPGEHKDFPVLEDAPGSYVKVRLD